MVDPPQDQAETSTVLGSAQQLPKPHSHRLSGRTAQLIGMLIAVASGVCALTLVALGNVGFQSASASYSPSFPMVSMYLPLLSLLGVDVYVWGSLRPWLASLVLWRRRIWSADLVGVLALADLALIFSHSIDPMSTAIVLLVIFAFRFLLERLSSRPPASIDPQSHIAAEPTVKTRAMRVTGWAALCLAGVVAAMNLFILLDTRSGAQASTESSPMYALYLPFVFVSVLNIWGWTMVAPSIARVRGRARVWSTVGWTCLFACVSVAAVFAIILFQFFSTLFVVQILGP